MNTENIFFTLIITFVRQSWWVILLMIAAYLIKLFAPIIKGKIGEGEVNLTTKLRLDPKSYHLIKDVTIPSKKGTTQIDHIIVSVFGIFLIETKNYKGWIFADAKSPKWTQVNFKKKHFFQNPLRQNYAHHCALSELLNIPKEKIHGIVCFMGEAKFKTDVPEGVFIHGRYINYIKSFRTKVFTEEETKTLTQQIETNRLSRGFKTNNNHVKQLNAHHASNDDETPPFKNNSVPNYSDPTCPACGAKMILRTAKRGVHAGKQFWGCSTYPTCKKIIQTT